MLTISHENEITTGRISMAIGDDLRNEAKSYAALSNITLKQYVRNAIREKNEREAAKKGL